MPEHQLITDPYLHEPKGVSSAPAGQIYISNGAGSGVWTFWPLGQATYADSVTGQVIGTTPSRLLIDGLGGATNTNNLPREIRNSGTLWDAANSKVVPIRQWDGYTVEFRVPLASVSGSPTRLRAQLDRGAGPTPTNVFLVQDAAILSPTGYITFTFSFTSGAQVLANGAQLFLNTDVGSVTLGAPQVHIAKTADGNL